MTWKYIAGFFDGEGSVVMRGKNFRITVPQSSKQVLGEIQKFSKVGHIYKLTKRQPHWLDSWVYCIAKQKDIKTFLYKIFPHLIVKKKQVGLILPKLQNILKKQNWRKDRRKNRIKTALKLRRKGLSYWRIGLQMNLDRGYVRRLVLSVEKKN